MGTRASLILALLLALLPQVGNAEGFESETMKSHRQAQCSLCHQFGDDTAPEFLASAQSEAGCISCHSEYPKSRPSHLDFHGQPGRRCTECHRFHEPDRIVTAMGLGKLPSRTEDAEGHCGACHFQGSELENISPGHRTAAELYHTGMLDLVSLTPSEACLACHSSQSTLLPLELIPIGTPAFNEHASHAYGVMMLPGAADPSLRIRDVLDPRIRLFDQQIECATCHQLSSHDEDLLVEFDDRYGLCQGCHEHGSGNSANLFALRE